MRCAQCGTQNEPDSRFCGGCGARMAGGENRLAPTEKIQSDAPMQVQPLSSLSPSAGIVAAPPRRMSAPPEMPPPTPVPSVRPDLAAPASIPPNNNGQWSAATPSYSGSPPSIPPQGSSGSGRNAGTGPASIPPQNNQVGTSTGPATSIPSPAPAGSQRGTAKPDTSSDAGVSMRPARTRWGLIILLLLLDAGLATAGTWMLLEGLADPPTVVAPASTTSGAIQPAASTVRVADVPPPPPASATKPADEKPLDTKPADEKPADARPVDAKPVDEKPVDEKPADEKPVEAKPVDEKPVDEKPVVDPEAVEPKPPLDAKPVEQKPTADKTGEQRGASEKPAKKRDEKQSNRKKPKEDGRSGPLDPYGDPLPPETK